MEYPNPNRKATAAKKFILSYYPQVERVEITYFTEDIPELKVYFNQEDTRIANESSIFREEIIRDIKNYLGFKLINPIMFNWEANKQEFQNPDMYIVPHSLNYNPFWREDKENEL
jgi:hypothetical protein